VKSTPLVMTSFLYMYPPECDTSLVCKKKMKKQNKNQKNKKNKSAAIYQLLTSGGLQANNNNKCYRRL